MQRFVNDPSRIVDDMLVGFLRNYSSLLAPTNNPRVVTDFLAAVIYIYEDIPDRSFPRRF